MPAKQSLLLQRLFNSAQDSLVAGGGFEPPKLSRQIYSLIPLAARESRLIHTNYAGILPATAGF